MKQKFIEWFTKNNNGCSPAMEDDRSFVRKKTQHMFEAYQAGVAEGEARCAALAAENAGMKEEISNITFMRDDDFFGSTQQAQEVMGRLVNIKTPATDAFLAEVRAGAVDEVCLKISNYIPNCYQDEQIGLDAAATICGDFASDLRKGVQS